MFGNRLNPVARAEKYIEKGNYKKAMKVLANTFKKYPNSLDLARLRFEYGKYIPFDDFHHQAAKDYFNLQMQFDVSGEKIHGDFVKYMTTTQGRIQLDDETLVHLSVVFAANGFENNAVYIINGMIRKECELPQFVDALVAVINYLEEKGADKKTASYKNYLKWHYPDHEMTHYILSKNR
ncbi:hypothetical protein MNBD_GAMMA02-760 [hydrothermal vent metagenome]|uniref:Uncharacterized protein n=1 Tax=hydrothermal vent metagenome TaxID=652676 RepID=A0A3B0VME2_9ZZZZ